MDTQAITGLLAQIPLVGIFIWFTLHMLKSFNTTIIEQRHEFLEALDKIAQKMEITNTQLILLNERLCNDK